MEQMRNNLNILHLIILNLCTVSPTFGSVIAVIVFKGEVHCKTIFQRVKEDVQGIIEQFLFFLETPPTLRKEPSKFRSCTPFSQFVRGYGRRLLVDCDGNGRTFLVVCYGMEELCSQFVTEMEGLDSQFVKERQNLLFYERFSFFPSQTTSKVLPLHS